MNAIPSSQIYLGEPLPTGNQAETQTDHRRLGREACGKPGRLAYGGIHPGMVGCEIVDMSPAGARVQTYAKLSDLPDFFTLELDGSYYRARRVWGSEREIGLEFIADEGWGPKPRN